MRSVSSVLASIFGIDSLQSRIRRSKRKKVKAKRNHVFLVLKARLLEQGIMCHTPQNIERSIGKNGSEYYTMTLCIWQKGTVATERRVYVLERTRRGLEIASETAL